MRILVINGPNLNMLGIREKEIYGERSYADLCVYIEEACAARGVTCTILQSNHEGEIVDWIQAAYGTEDAIIINPAAYSHTSVAILDALKAVALPAVEVHISKVDKREEFRRFSYTAMGCEKTISGKGFEGYKEAICYLIEKAMNSENTIG